MDESQLMQDAVDAVVQTPVTLHFQIEPDNKLHALLQKWGWKPKQRSFELRPMTYGNLMRVAKLWLKLGLKEEKQGALLDSIMTIMATQTPLVAEMLAIVIHNRKSYPSKSLTNFILHNMTKEEGRMLLNVIVKQVDPETFLSGLVSLRGLNVLPQAEKNGQTARGL